MPGASFSLHSLAAALEEQAEQKKSGKRAAQQPPAPEHVADSEEVLAATTSNKRAKAADSEPWARAADAVELESSEDATAQRKPKATGRVCVECGATSTPQWREGPQGEEGPTHTQGDSVGGHTRGAVQRPCQCCGMDGGGCTRRLGKRFAS